MDFKIILNLGLFSLVILIPQPYNSIALGHNMFSKKIIMKMFFILSVIRFRMFPRSVEGVVTPNGALHGTILEYNCNIGYRLVTSL